MSHLSKAHVIVCGSTFGAMHVRAVFDDPLLDLIGIYASGSERSQRLADSYQVPLITSVEEIPRFNDGLPCLASVVIRSSILGGKAAAVACDFMDVGYDVLLEPPVHFEEFTQLAKKAGNLNRKIATGNLYRRLPHMEAFAKAFATMQTLAPVDFLEVSASSHVVFYLVDILGQIFPGKVLRIDSSDIMGPFVLLKVHLGNLPVSICIHNEVDDQSPDSYSHMLFRLNAHTGEGTLQLAEIVGPLTWLPQMRLQECGQSGLPEAFDGMRPVERLMDADERDYSSWMAEAWTQAIALDLNTLRQSAEGNSRAAATILSARNWTTATNSIRYPSTKHMPRERLVDLGALKAALI